jgi:type VI protein secretion system component Hcp
MADHLDAFMRLKGIDGESSDAEFKGKKVFELISFSISPDSQTLTFKKPSDLATAVLHQKYCLNFSRNNKTEKWVTAGRLWVRKDCGGIDAGKIPGTAYLIYDFKKMSVKKFDWSVSDSGIAEDDITMSFEGLLVKYRPQKATGELGTFQMGAWNFSEKGTAMTECTDGEIF